MSLEGGWKIFTGGILTGRALYFMLALLFVAGICAIRLVRDIFGHEARTTCTLADRIEMWVIRVIALIIFASFFYLLWAYYRWYYGITFLDLKDFPYPDQWLILLSKLIQPPSAAGYIEPRGYYYLENMYFLQAVLQSLAFILGMLTEVAWPNYIGLPKKCVLITCVPSLRHRH